VVIALGRGFACCSSSDRGQCYAATFSFESPVRQLTEVCYVPELEVGVVRKCGAMLWGRSARRWNNEDDVARSQLQRKSKLCQGEVGESRPVTRNSKFSRCAAETLTAGTAWLEALRGVSDRL
jgi:hypothetical protein